MISAINTKKSNDEEHGLDDFNDFISENDRSIMSEQQERKSS